MANVAFGNYTPPKKEDLMENEVIQPIKIQQTFLSSYVMDKTIGGKKYAMTVVCLYDFKQYFQSYRPLDNEKIYSMEDVVAVGLDGNGVPRLAWHKRSLFESKPITNTNSPIIDNLLGTRQTMEKSKVAALPAILTTDDQIIRASKEEAKADDLETDISCNNTLRFANGKQIVLKPNFVQAIQTTSDFTRENDVTLPYAMVNKEIQKFDNIRTAVGLASSLLPIGRGSVKMISAMVGLLSEAVGGSPLVLPASKLYNLRGPIKLSKVTKETFESFLGQDSNYHYPLEGRKEILDNVTITY